MPDVVGIRFKSCGKIYDFEVEDLEVNKGDAVVVESELGLSIGSVVVEKHPFTAEGKELKKVLRKAAEDDLRQRKDNETIETEAKAYCQERIMARGLPMKLICTEATLDKKRIIFYFAAEGRIDFRELVKDLASKFKTRIEMRQIGVRDEAKMIGGIGICGRELCCKRFLTTFEPISIKMAKSQELVLNANKLSGVCGRLMCCLSYEYSDEADDVLCEAATASTVETGDLVQVGSAENSVPSIFEAGAENGGEFLPAESGERSNVPERVDREAVSGQVTVPGQIDSVIAQDRTDAPATTASPDQKDQTSEQGFRRRRRRRRRRHRR